MKKESLNRKKSQQSIIVVVLLVLIGLVAVAAVGLFIMKNIQTSIQMSELKSKSMDVLTELKSAKITDDRKIAAVTIGLGEGKPDETITRRANIVISNAAGQTQTYTSHESLLPGSFKTHYIYLTVSNPTKIEVLPVLISGAQTYVGSASASITPTSSSSEINTANILKDGLAGYWSFNGASGVFTDDSGNGNTGTCTSCPVQVPGIAGKAYQFDGVNDLITIHYTSSLEVDNSITISAWVKPGNIAGRNTIYSTSASSGTGGPSLEIGSEPSTAHVYTNGIALITPGAWNNYVSNVLVLNQWHHIVYTRQDKVEKIYMNKIDRLSTASIYVNFATNGEDQLIGARPGQPFNGLIDEVRIYNRALSAEEVGWLYDSSS